MADCEERYQNKKSRVPPVSAARDTDTDVDPDDPEPTKPMPRYNAMLAVLRNTLYL